MMPQSKAMIGTIKNLDRVIRNDLHGDGLAAAQDAHEELVLHLASIFNQERHQLAVRGIKSIPTWEQVTSGLRLSDRSLELEERISSSSMSTLSGDDDSMEGLFSGTESDFELLFSPRRASLKVEPLLLSALPSLDVEPPLRPLEMIQHCYGASQLIAV